MSKTNVNVVKNANVKEVISAQIEKNSISALEQFKTLAEKKVNTEINLESLVKLYNQLESKDKTASNKAVIEKMILAINDKLKADIVSPYALLNNAELLKALCNVTVKIADKDDVKTIANKIKLAINYKSLSLKDDNGTLSVKDRLKAVTVSDVLESKAVLNASKKADKTVTKEDVKAVVNDIIDESTKGILYCSLHTACRLNNISETKIAVTEEYTKVYNALKVIFESNKKENPFDKVSNNALQSQLEISVSTLLGNADYDSKCTKAYAQMYYNMLIKTDMSNGLQIECNDIFKVLQSLIVVCRYMYNGIKPMIQFNKTIHTTK